VKARLLALGLALGLVSSGCSSLHGVQEMPLPGGADLGGHPIHLTASFSSVLSLVPQSAVKVNDVAVGRVTKITLPPGGWTAQVTMVVNGRVRLPANAYAELRQSGLLGEKYIALSPPADGTGTGRLADGARIPITRTDRNPEIEEVLGALSMLLNGGGVAQLRTITVELNHALSGNEPQIRDLLGRLNDLSSSLNANKQSITNAIDGLNRLFATLNARKGQIATVLDQLTPGIKALNDQRSALVHMLNSLDRLSKVSVNTITKSKADVVADLQLLEPTLRKLSDSGRTLPQSLQVLLTYPFTDAVLPAIKGDYMNVYLSVTAKSPTQIIPPLNVPPTPLASSAGKGN